MYGHNGPAVACELCEQALGDAAQRAAAPQQINDLRERTERGAPARVGADQRAGERTVRSLADENIAVFEEIVLSEAEYGRTDLAGGFHIHAGKLLPQLFLFIKLVEHQRGQRWKLVLTGFSHVAPPVCG